VGLLTATTEPTTKRVGFLTTIIESTTKRVGFHTTIIESTTKRVGFHTTIIESTTKRVGFLLLRGSSDLTASVHHVGSHAWLFDLTALHHVGGHFFAYLARTRFRIVPGIVEWSCVRFHICG
jgi:hypothetical protein